MRPFSEAVRPLVPVCLFFVVCTLWVIYSPADILELDPRCVYMVAGTIFSNICVSGTYCMWSSGGSVKNFVKQ
jgi:ethanolaminephosphotransferase